MIFYALTIFWSALLLFLVQPILGKQILPWFGGAPAVWTTCLLFFQILLLGGYVYTHGLSAWLRPRAQAIVHMGLLAGSLWMLPIAADPAYRSEIQGEPTWQILSLLLFTVGAPYFLLSATGPLLQAWFAKTHARSPYRLYALSNVGSLLALLGYPFLVEPNLKLGEQTANWSWGYAVFAAVCGVCAVQLLLRGERDSATGANGIVAALDSPSNQSARPATTQHESPRATLGVMMLWLGLTTMASAMLMATTNLICQEVAVVPFLWILPLVLYLFSFIICFDSPRWYLRWLFFGLLIITASSATVLLYLGPNASIFSQIAVYALTLFAAAMVCHGELARSRPPSSQLTLFYLLAAAGGALGGLFVAIVAPACFTGYWEYPISLVGCCTLGVIALARDRRGPFYRPGMAWLWPVSGLALATLLALLWMQATAHRQGVVDVSRNFYGVLRVHDDLTPAGLLRELSHGRITHGLQFLDEDKRRLPISYFSHPSGIGLVLDNHPRRQAADVNDRNLRIGVIGLGIGTIAAYGQPGDVIRFYEINPDVIRFANQDFTYLRDSPATIETAEGDARLVLENELRQGSQQFDILAMDAFSSDAIPMHLITRECVEMYWRHLKPDGVLLCNIRNRSVDLTPLMRGLAEISGKQVFRIDSPRDDAGAYDASWAVLTSNPALLSDPQIQSRREAMPDNTSALLWTDDYGSLWQVIRGN